MIVASAVVCLALNMYHEARGESDVGQVAVAKVTLNRVLRNNSEVCEEVFKPKQFSWANGKVQKKGKRWLVDDSMKPKEPQVYFKLLVFAHLLLDANPSYSDKAFREATHYHTKQVSPQWAKKLKKVAVVGNHIFYKKG